MSTSTKTKRVIKLSKAKKYGNVFYNNEKTTFDTVIAILNVGFGIEFEKAIQLTTEIHVKGSAVVFISSKEICEAKQELIEAYKSKLKDTELKTTVELQEDGDD
jgi:ATP-dependent Clp protease adapter protein ClpS